jgi:rhodanese-related sulfurtransferase
MKTIQAPELAQWLNDPSKPAPQILDVRESWELEICKLPNTIHIPMGEVPSRSNELDPDKPIVCLCHHGVRSYQVGLFLKNRDFTAVYNMQGGIDAWSQLVDPECPSY